MYRVMLVEDDARLAEHVVPAAVGECVAAAELAREVLAAYATTAFQLGGGPGGDQWSSGSPWDALRKAGRRLRAALLRHVGVSGGVHACGSAELLEVLVASDLQRLLGDEYLYFYDAISPIVDASSLEMDRGFFADRYGSGSGDYLNFPMTRHECEEFLSALLSARVVPAREFEEERYFESCLPVEVLASRGPETLLFGPMRPVGLRDPRTGEVPHAVVQLAREQASAAGSPRFLLGSTV